MQYLIEFFLTFLYNITASVNFAKKQSKLVGKMNVLEVNRFNQCYMAFSVLLISVVMGLILVTQEVHFMITTMFLTCAVIFTGYFTYVAFCIKISYDCSFFYYQSPLNGYHKIPWKKLVSVESSATMLSLKFEKMDLDFSISEYRDGCHELKHFIKSELHHMME